MPYSFGTVRFFFLFLLFAGLFCGCIKTKPTNKPLPNSVDSFANDPGGTLYINIDVTLRKVEVNTAVTDWSTSLLYGFGSYNSPVNFDSGYVYFGGLYGLAAYNYQTGAEIWATGDNNQLSSMLYVTNSYIYCTSGQYAYCYSIKDGSLQWQIDMQFATGFTSTYTFLDDNKLIVCRNYAFTSNVIKEFNAFNGSLMNTLELDVPGALDFRGYAYGANVLYTISYVGDSIEMHALDLATNLQKWKYRYFQSYTQTAVVTPNYIIFPSGKGDSSGLNVQSEMMFLNLNGTLKNRSTL